MAVCDRCGKGALIGRNVSHAKQRTRKVSLPNLHPVRLVRDGRKVKMRLCTQCLRIVKKEIREKQKAVATP